MKKLLIILLIFTAFTSSAQVYQRDPSYGRSIDRYEVLKDLGIPTFCGTPEVNSTVTNKAKIAYDSCGHLLYKYDPSTGLWSAASGSDLSNYYSKTQIDSIFSLIGVYNLDGRISGGIVSWTGSGLSFNVSASEFRKFGIIYHTNDTTITLDAADVTYSRIDLFALDTTNGGEVIKITGTPAPTPVAPQVLDYQIALTTGITLNVGDTVPANVSIQKIYDENIEWATSQNGSVTVNFNDVSNPFSGTKDALVSLYSGIGRLVFTRSGTGVMDGSEVLKMHISLRDTLKAGRYISVLFLNNSTPLSSGTIPITKNNGLDPNIVNQYQTIQIPASVFQFTSTTYNRLIIYATGYDTSGTGGFYLDDVELQSGINNVPSPTDISGKVNYIDSNKIFVTPTQLAALHNNLNLYWPLYGDNADTSVHFKNDSLPLLTYAPGTDTSGTNSMDVPSKGWVLDRLGSSSSSTDTTSLSSRIDAKQDALTLTTTGTSGAATLTGSFLNIPQYSGGGSSSTVTEQKTYYHNEFYWNHGLNTSTGAITSDTSKDVSDYLPIEPSTSITIGTTDSSLITIYGWTYDSSYTPISEIRSNSLIGTKLKTYTFTTPSNAAYYIVYTKAAGDSFNLRLTVKSTNTVTYNVPITPEQFSGTAQQKIQQALYSARFRTASVVLNGYYLLDSGLVLSSGNTVIMRDATLKLKNDTTLHPIFTNEAIKNDTASVFHRGNHNIKIIGEGEAIIEGATVHSLRASLYFVGLDGFELSGLTFRNMPTWATQLIRCRNGIIRNITFENGFENLNQDGIHLVTGSHDINISDIKGVTQDDIVALTNIKQDTANAITYKVQEPYSTNNDIYNISIKNIHANKTRLTAVGPPKLYSTAIRLLTGDGLKIHDVTFDGLFGVTDFQIQSLNTSYYTVAPTAKDVFRINVSNSYIPIYVYQPIKNSTFKNIVSHDTSGNVAARMPTGSLNIYRHYMDSIPKIIDSVVASVEYIHSLDNYSKITNRDQADRAMLRLYNNDTEVGNLSGWGNSVPGSNGFSGNTTISAANNLILYSDNTVNSGGTHNIQFRTGGDNQVQERMRIFSNGGIGINETNDSTTYKLNVNGSIFGTSLYGSNIYGSNGSAGSLTLNSTSHATKGSIFFGTSSVYVESNGRWGLGTTTPGYDLTMLRTSTATPLEARLTNTSTNFNTFAGVTLVNSTSNGGIKKNSVNWSGAGGSDLNIYNTTKGNISLTNTAGSITIQTGSSTAPQLTVDSTGRFIYQATNTATGTTGDQTIDKPTGTVNFAAAASSLVVTNALVKSTSLVFIQIIGTDATAKSATVSISAGSFTINLNAAATAETKVAFWVIN